MRTVLKYLFLTCLVASLAMSVYIAFDAEQLLDHRKIEAHIRASLITGLYDTGQHNPQGTVKPRVLVIVFPQFHQDPLNDYLWGEGFTDWNNLKKAPPKNRLGFDIPRPLEVEDGGLGFYDYTHLAPRKRQSELAKQYQIDGFVYHHYWFYDLTHPGPNLHAPLEAMLLDGRPDVPFCLHWCAADWSKTWLSETREGIKSPKNGFLQQQYFPSGNITAIKEHYNWLRRFFHHPNYITVQNQPVFMVYRMMVGSYAILRQLRQLAIEDGFPSLYITVGLDRPHPHLTPASVIARSTQRATDLGRIPFDLFNKTANYPNPNQWNEGRSFEIPEKQCPSVASASIANQTLLKSSVEIPGILVSFDNTPRRPFESAVLWSGEEPSRVIDRFRASLTNALWYESCCFTKDEPTSPFPDSNPAGWEGWFKQKEHYAAQQDDARFILINSMNEWAEGMALEPSNVFGFSLLEALKESQTKVKQSQCHPLKSI